MDHKCPGPGCDKQVPADMLMCRAHWYQVPKALRNAVWAAWRRGEGAGSPAHTAAITAAIEAVNR
jgi:hypothetical protein